MYRLDQSTALPAFDSTVSATVSQALGAPAGPPPRGGNRFRVSSHARTCSQPPL
jgi:hypothetical protein